MQTLHDLPKAQMTLHEKRAWFNVAVFVVTLIAFLVALYFLGFNRSLGSLGLCGLMGLNPYYYQMAFLARRTKQESGVVLDERDVQIHQKANLIAYIIFWLGLVLAALYIWATHQSEGKISIPVVWIAAFPLAAFFLR